MTITYAGADDVPVTEGWFRVKRGETTAIGQYPSGSPVYLLARDGGQLWEATSTQDGKEIDIVDNSFTHAEPQPIIGNHPRKVKASRDEFSNRGTLTHTFYCAPGSDGSPSSGVAGEMGPR